MKFGSDIDGVVFRCEVLYLSVINLLLGTHYSLKDIKQYDIAKNFGLDKDFVQHAIGAVIGSGIYPVEKGVQKYLSAIAELAESPIYFITARRPMWRNTTKAAVGELFDFDYEIIHTRYGSNNLDKHNKEDIITDLGLDYFVEDCGEHANAIHECTSFCKSIIMDRAWNRWVDEKEISRVYNWKQIYNICYQGEFDNKQLHFRR